jgi:hypothetical protein
MLHLWHELPHQNQHSFNLLVLTCMPAAYLHCVQGVLQLGQPGLQLRKQLLAPVHKGLQQQRLQGKSM